MSDPLREIDADIKLDAGDVTVVEIGPTLCDSCMERPVTHYVMLDMRITGSMTAVAECCEACAEEFATDLRASLPAAESTSGSTT